MAKYNEKYFNFDGMHDNKIEDLIEKDEQLLFKKKPKKSAFIASKIFQMLPIALIWILLDGFFIYMMISQDIFSHIPVALVVFIVIFFIFHLTPVWIWISNVVTAWAQYKNIEYVFTNRRIIIRTGIFVDIKNVYYADIQSVNLKVGIIDRMMKVGDIYIVASSGAVVLWDIENPYKITNELQKIVNDIKTDIEFPNKFRPSENPGFNTKYIPENKSKNSSVSKKEKAKEKKK